MIKWIVKKYIKSKLNDILDNIDNIEAPIKTAEGILYKLNVVSGIVNSIINAIKDKKLTNDEIDTLEKNISDAVEDIMR